MRRDPLNPGAADEVSASAPGSGQSVPAPPPVRRDEDVGLIEDFVVPTAVPPVPDFEPRPDEPDRHSRNDEVVGRTTTSFRIDGGTVTTFPPKEPPGDGFGPAPDVSPWEPTYESFDVAPDRRETSGDREPTSHSATGSLADTVSDDLSGRIDADESEADPTEAPSIFANEVGADEAGDPIPDPDESPFWAVTTDLPAVLDGSSASTPRFEHPPPPRPRERSPDRPVVDPTAPVDGVEPIEAPGQQGPDSGLGEPSRPIAAAPEGPITVDQALYGMDEPGRRADQERYESDLELDALLADLSAIADSEPTGYDAPGRHDVGPFAESETVAPGGFEQQPILESEPDFSDEPRPWPDTGRVAPEPQVRPQFRQAPRDQAPLDRPPAHRPTNDRPPAHRPTTDRYYDVANDAVVVSPHLVNRPIIQAGDMGRAERFDYRLWSMVLKGLIMVMVLAIVVMVALSLS